MSVLPIAEKMSSAEFARVKEITPVREFLVENDGDSQPARIEFFTASDSLYCHTHRERDNCAHTFRARMCGILTNTVNKEAKVYRRKRDR